MTRHRRSFHGLQARAMPVISPGRSFHEEARSADIDIKRCVFKPGNRLALHANAHSTSQDRHIVLFEHGIAGYHCQPFHPGLGDEHAVERIAVMHGQIADSIGVPW